MKKFPVGLSFDVDGETLWTSRSHECIKHPCQLSMGSYGLNEGIPRILKLLAKYNIKATFFIVGATAEKYPDSIKCIAKAGHELGNHSWTHTHPDHFNTKEEEKEELVRTCEIIYRLTGIIPTGYRSPAAEFSKYTVEILDEMGFTWESSMMDWDRMVPLKVFGQESNVLHIPFHWRWDDAPFWMYGRDAPGKAMQSLSAVKENWFAEFDGVYNEFMEDATEERKNACFMLTCHPQLIGQIGKLGVLESFIQYILGKPNSVFMTGQEMVDYYKSKNSYPFKKVANNLSN